MKKLNSFANAFDALLILALVATIIQHPGNWAAYALFLGAGFLLASRVIEAVARRKLRALRTRLDHEGHAQASFRGYHAHTGKSDIPVITLTLKKRGDG